MNPSREEALFVLAVEKPASERPAFLDAVCGADAALRRQVEALLASHDATRNPLVTEVAPERPTIKLDLDDAPDEAVGQTLGRYKLLERIGEGGCGVVYVAEQTEPVRRRVALKVIKLGMDTKQVVARFEAERQALAMMDHPNIAKVLDAGTTDVGRPFFVMELVRGIPFTHYCDQAQLSTKDRLDLFIKVCQAIQHAHQKGIIHRDIKPSNILVTLHDGVPVPKVIDFGIAKATEGRLTDNTVYTQLHQFIGTPAYMSPEQAEMSGLDIDTRSDIYSLGVLLYELLAGSTPFDAKELMASGIDQMRKTIREKEPQRPSTRLATLGADQLTTTAKRRSADTSKLLHQLKGDLDWIVMKCLEKDRQRRYDTANGLAADLKRHLNNEPVVARPPSQLYRFQKAWRRNKLIYVAVTAVFATLLVGITVSSWQMMVARRARSNEAAQRAKAEGSEKMALASAQNAKESLYDSLVGQARATRVARKVGFREEVFTLLRQARNIDTPRSKLLTLRQEAVASMGDFVGLRSRQIASAPATNGFQWMRLSPDGRLLAISDKSGGIQLREISSGRELGRWNLEGRVWDLVFNRAGDRLLSVHVPDGAFDSEARCQRLARARVAEFTLNLTAEWQQTKWQRMPGAFGCISISNSVFVVVADEWSCHRMDVVDPESGRTTHSIRRPEGSWTLVAAATRDGQKLALVGSGDSRHPEPEIEIWDLQREQLIRRLPPGFSSEASISFSIDGRYLLNMSNQGTRVYETSDFSIVDEFSGYATGDNGGSFLPGTPLVAVPLPQQRRFQIRNHQLHETVAVLEVNDWPFAAAFTPGGELFVAGSATGVSVYQLTGANECLALSGHRVSVPGIAFSPDGARLASVSKDRTVAMWDAGSGRRIWEGDAQLPSIGQAVGFSPDGKLLATGDWDTPQVQLWDAESGQQLLQLTNASAGLTWSLQFVTDPHLGVLLVRGSGPFDGSQEGVSVWHIGPSRSVLNRVTGAVRWLGSRSLGMGLGLVATPDGRRIAFRTFTNASHLEKGSTIVQDPMGKSPPITIAPNITAMCVQPLSFTPDGQFVAVVTTENQVEVFDATTGKSRRTLGGTAYGTDHLQIALSPLGRSLATVSSSKRGVDIYDFTTGELRYTLPDREGTVYWLAWHPNGLRLAIARDNGDVTIWNLAKIDRQLAELGLGFLAEAADAAPAKEAP